LLDLEQAAPDAAAQLRLREVLEDELGLEDAPEVPIGAVEPVPTVDQMSEQRQQAISAGQAAKVVQADPNNLDSGYTEQALSIRHFPYVAYARRRHRNDHRHPADQRGNGCKAQSLFAPKAARGFGMDLA
jgi:hypothetical protein